MPAPKVCCASKARTTSCRTATYYISGTADEVFP
jgi:hypothetical protein